MENSEGNVCAYGRPDIRFDFLVSFRDVARVGNGGEQRLFSPFAAANASSRTHILPRPKRDGTAEGGLEQKEEEKPCIFFFWNDRGRHIPFRN